jgi:hypothetical protein
MTADGLLRGPGSDNRAERPVLDETQQRVLDAMRRDGIAIVPFQELFHGEEPWATLAEDIGKFARATEAQAGDLLEREDDKAYIARRFVVRKSADTKAKKWTFPLSDPWLRLGLSKRILDIVNAYRGKPANLIDLDNWYTVPDPSVEKRIESQQWHRDPWDNHIVKLFIYFSEVDEGAGPFEYVRGSPDGGRYGELWPWVPSGIYPPPDEFEAAVAPSDRLKVTGPPGTMIFCDTSGFHCGGAARTSPRVLSYHTYVCPPTDKSPRFKVDWTRDDTGLSPAGCQAIAWSRKRAKRGPEAS